MLTRWCSFEYWQAYGPNGMVPRLFDYKYYRRQCPLYFPETNGHTFGINKGLSADNVVKRTGGWDNAGNSTRLMWVNGEFDPWRSASVVSDYRPQGKLTSSDAVPSFLLPKAAHCNDMIIKNAEVNPAVGAIVQQEIAKMKQWVDDFYKQKHNERHAHS